MLESSGLKKKKKKIHEAYLSCPFLNCFQAPNKNKQNKKLNKTKQRVR